MSKGKLLLADDSITIQKVVNLTFADEGIDVVAVENGDLAMQMIAEQRPDIVLADVNMPGLNGYQICERLSQSDETKDIPVLLLVGSFEPFDESEANRVGARGFMTKPFQSIRLLVSRVSELLERSDRTADSEVTSEPVAATPADEPLSASEPDEPQTADIEDLYNQSLADTVEIPKSESESSGEFADAGMDDEIIETTYVSGEVTNAGDLPPNKSPFEERVSYESENSVPQVDAVESDREFEDSNAQLSEEFIDSTTGLAFDETQEMPDYQPDAVWSKVVSSPNDGSIVDLATPNSDRSEDKANSYSLSESELLELPGNPSHQAIGVPQRPAPPAPNPVTELSPELIDLIVQKVIEKLSEKQLQD